MWKVCRRTILKRWQTRKQNAVKTKSPITKEVRLLTFSPAASSDSKSSGDNSKQHAHNQKRNFWNHPQFSCSFNRNFVETVGWLLKLKLLRNETVGKGKTSFSLKMRFPYASEGTVVAVSLNIQQKVCKVSKYHDGLKVQYDKTDCFHACSSALHLLSRFAFSMPKEAKKSVLPEKVSLDIIIKQHDITDSKTSSNEQFCKDSAVESALQEMEEATVSYVAHLENIAGLQLLNKDHNKAMKYLKASGQLGCSKALFNLGLFYETGKGSNIDLEKAVYYYTQAAAKGHKYAIYNLGIFHLQGLGGLSCDSKTGMELIMTAAELGVPEAQVYLGIQYLEEEKWLDAFIMFNESARQDNIEAEYYLGVCYENGWGTSQNDTKAADKYSHAAAHGHEDATFSLGTFYEYGRGGLNKDLQFAKSLYELAADKGHEGAKSTLSNLPISRNFISDLSDIKDQPAKEDKMHIISHDSQISLHVSASSPELNLHSSLLQIKDSYPTVSHYLDLILPSINFRRLCTYEKPCFYLNAEDQEPVIDTTTSDLMGWYNMPLLVRAGL